MQKNERDRALVVLVLLDLDGRDTLAIGIAALALGLMSRHLLGDEIGFNILAGAGHVIIIIGLVRVFVRDED